jgi:hypothetical protein
VKSRNEQALKTIAITLAALTYAAAVLYGDVQFLTVMQSAFPNDPMLRALAMAGAVMTAVSAMTLPIALHWWFSPGLQFIWGVGFWLIDILALGLNAMLAYELATGVINSIVATWQIVAPATPLLAVVGWGIAFLLDPSHRERHARAEMEANQIDTYADQMRKAANSEEVYAEILAAARLRAREFAESLSGRRMPETHRSADKVRGNGHLQHTLNEAVEVVEPKRPNA